MSRIPFSSVGGYAVGSTGQYTIIDSFGNISASGANFSGNITAPNIVNSLNGATGSISITSGSNIVVTTTGNLITIGTTGNQGVTPAFVVAMSIAL
jgi:hypothetical protein